MKFTPGPWHVDDSAYVRKVLLKGEYLAVAAENSGVICYLYKENWSVNGEKDLANARLIAAAPELLAACKNAIPVIVTLQNRLNAPEAGDWMIEVLRKAIAKAE